jgi:hypothetical protein
VTGQASIRCSIVLILTSLSTTAQMSEPHDGRLCVEPEAPVEVALRAVAQSGEIHELAWEVTPVLPLRALSWEVRLLGTARVVRGEVRGTELPSDGALLPARERAAFGVLEVHVPRDGAHKRVELVATGELASGGDPVVARALLEWERPQVFGTRVDSPRHDGVSSAIVLGPSTSSGARAVPAPPGASSAFQVFGDVVYEDKSWAWSGWTGEDPLRPVRHAAVTVLDAGSGEVLGSGATDAEGAFSITCPSSETLVDVQLRVDCDTRLDPSVPPMLVQDLSGNLWGVLSPVAAGHDTGADLDMGTVAALKVLVGSDEGNPFNILDVILHGMEWVLGPEVGAGFPPDTLVHHYPSGAGSFAYPQGAWMSDDDGYDDPVILHELGHVVHSQYSDHDSPGGQHFFGDSDQDPRLSFSEGFATFFNGMVLTSLGRSAIYMDASASQQLNGAGLKMRLETAAPYQTDAFGAADEVAVACVLYDLLDTADTKDTEPGVDDDALDGSLSIGELTPTRAFWELLVGPLADADLVTQNDVWDHWLALYGGDAQGEALTEVFELRRQRFVADGAEPDDSPAQAVPQPVVPGNGSWSDERTLYAVPAGGPGPGTIDNDWILHDLVAGSVVRLETRYPGGAPDADTQADTVLQVFDPQLQPLAIDFDSGAGRNARLAELTIDSSGEWRVLVAVQDPTPRRYGRYEYRASYVFENHVPVITTGPLALPPGVADDATTTLWAQATDPDEGHLALSYEWTPLDGGNIVGTGPGVTFVPPVVQDETQLRIRVVVIDPLGAASAPAEVTVLVHPAGTTVCESQGSVLAGGTGKAGLFGVPSLVAVGAPTLPSAGFGMRVGGAHPGITGVLVVGLSAAAVPFDGGLLQPMPDALLPLQAGSDGIALLSLPLPSDPNACGLKLWAQAVFPDDPGAAGSKATAQSNWLEITFGG